MMPAFTIAVAVGCSIGVGFASATELMAASNASIKGFIGLASLLNAEGQLFAMSDSRLGIQATGHLMLCSWNLKKSQETLGESLPTKLGADWSKRHPRIVEEAARIKGHAVMDAEVVCLDAKELQISTLCITALPITLPSLVHSIC
jgi:hypothetical protein